MEELVGLKTKMYSIKVVAKEITQKKELRKAYLVKNETTSENCKKRLHDKFK